MRRNIKDLFSNALLVFFDTAAVALSVFLAFLLRKYLDGFFSATLVQPLSAYMEFPLIYIAALGMFFYEGIYTRRYDFWHESQHIFKALGFAFFIVLSYLAMTKSIEEYSRAVIIFSFLFMSILIPLFKNISKKLLFKGKLWQREAKVYGDDNFIKEEIFNNPYLGYIEARHTEPRTVFINSKGIDAEKLKAIIDGEIVRRHEVIFIPLMDDYDLTESHIYGLANTRTNLIVFQNRLKSRYRVVLKQLSDLVMFMIAFPLLLPLLAMIAYKIRKEEPGGAILFRQERMGKNDQVFVCYKFRTMYEKNDSVLRQYLEANPEEVAYYDKYHKYRNDPRITKIGAFLRRTSLDELPQIFNVIRGEMSFVGPRPYMLSEKAKIGAKIDTVLSVKPGITGLWQVSGRSEIDFHERVNLDVWYIRNWNLWMDVVILLKTVKAVLFKEGAQ